MNKPRIRKCKCTGVWMCIGIRFASNGTSPLDAFNGWVKARNNPARFII